MNFNFDAVASLCRSQTSWDRPRTLPRELRPSLLIMQVSASSCLQYKRLHTHTQPRAHVCVQWSLLLFFYSPSHTDNKLLLSHCCTLAPHLQARKHTNSCPSSLNVHLSSIGLYLHRSGMFLASVLMVPLSRVINLGHKSRTPMTQ